MNCYWNLHVDIVYWSKKNRCSFLEYSLLYRLPMTSTPVMGTKVDLPLSRELTIEFAMSSGNGSMGSQLFLVDCEAFVLYDEEEVEALAAELMDYGFEEYPIRSVERRPGVEI